MPIIEICAKMKLCSVNNKYVNRQYALTDDYRNFKKSIGMLARISMRKLKTKRTDKPCKLTVRFTSAKDTDNIIKPLKDGLKKIAIEDDDQILWLDIRREPGKRGCDEDIYIRLDEIN